VAVSAVGRAEGEVDTSAADFRTCRCQLSQTGGRLPISVIALQARAAGSHRPRMITFAEATERKTKNAGSPREPALLSVVAGPRNHLDLLCKPDSRKAAGLFSVSSQGQDAGEFAAQLDPQLAALGHEADLVDQRADELEGGAICRMRTPRRCDGQSLPRLR